MDATTYDELESATGVLHTDGSLAVQFTVHTSGSYFLKITHRNSIETWSAAAVDITTLDGAHPYDFSSSASQAYGDNQVLVDNISGQDVYAIYSGDIADASTGILGDHDGVIETSDYSEMENAVYFTLLGYQVQDITGDGVVETSDYSLMENNVYYTIVAKRPF
jgi:hypothetical protein